MPTPAQIGKNQYRELIRRARENNQTIREALRRLSQDNPGPQTQAVLITRIAVATGSNEAIFSELDEIGRQTKSAKSGE